MNIIFEEKRVALYIRVSTEEQVLRGYSLEAQKETLIQFAKENKMKIVDFYIDEGVSARKKYTTRKEFMRMLQDIKNNKIDVVLFIKLDRWFRSVADYYKVQEILEKHNVVWKAALENYDTATANGRLHINIKLSIAQDESDRTSERIKFVFENKIKNKEVITGMIPLGYRIENKKLVIDSEKSKIIKAIYNKFSSTHAIRTTTNYISNTYGLNMCNATIKNILKNKLYIGEYRNVTNYCPPIIDKELFYNVQKNLKRSVRIESTYTYIFTSLVFCSLCNNSMSGFGSKGYRYYRCRYKSDRNLCTGATISELYLEEYLINNIAEQISISLNYNTNINNSSKKTNIDKSLIKRKLTKLKDLYLNDLISLDEYKKDYDKYTSLLKKDENNNNESNSKKLLSTINFFSNKEWVNIYKTFSNNDKRIFWRRFISRIFIDDSKNITIEFL